MSDIPAFPVRPAVGRARHPLGGQPHAHATARSSWPSPRRSRCAPRSKSFRCAEANAALDAVRSGRVHGAAVLDCRGAVLTSRPPRRAACFTGGSPLRKERTVDPLDLVQWPAMVVTVVAAWLVASTSKRRRALGFWCFLLSNVLWIAWGWHTVGVGARRAATSRWPRSTSAAPTRTNRRPPPDGAADGPVQVERQRSRRLGLRPRRHPEARAASPSAGSRRRTRAEHRSRASAAVRSGAAIVTAAPAPARAPSGATADGALRHLLGPRGARLDRGANPARGRRPR